MTPLELSARETGPSSCPLCREPLGEGASQCPGCEVGYHRDCLLELGGCATLGCERRGQPPVEETPPDRATLAARRAEVQRRLEARRQAEALPAVEPTRPRWRPGRWLTGLAIVVGSPLLTFLLVYPLARSLMTMLAIMVVLPLTWWIGHRVSGGKKLGVAVGIALFTGFFMAGGAKATYHYWFGRTVSVSIAEAPRHPEADTLEFEDGEVRADLHYARVWTTTSKDRKTGTTSTTTHYRTVAPIVPPGWTPEQPVPAWAVTRSHGAPPERWIGARVGLRADPGDEESFREAIASAEWRHGLRTAPGAPMLEAFTPELISRYRWAFWIVLLVGAALWSGYCAYAALRGR